MEVPEQEDRTTTLPPTFERELSKTPYISPPEYKRTHLFKSPKEFEAIDNHVFEVTLRKHAYSNTLKILPTKMKIFRYKILILLTFLLKNIDCGYLLEPLRRCGSNEYPQSMFLSRNKKNNVYPCKPQFYYIKVGFEGSTLHRYVFVRTLLPVKRHVKQRYDGCSGQNVSLFLYNSTGNSFHICGSNKWP